MRHLIWTVPLAILAGCTSSNGTLRDNGPAESRTFGVGAFDRVALQGSDDVRVVRGPVASVVATGPAGVLDRLDIRVEDGVLKVGRKREGWRVGWSGQGATVTVTTPALRGAAVAGSGDMSVDRAEGDVFRASVAGSGNLGIASLTAKRADLNLSGSGDLTVAGRAPEANLSIAGSGSIDASKLVSARAQVSAAGSGNASIDAREAAEVSIVGSGDVTVSGTRNCKVSSLGSGEVRCAG